MRSKVTVKDIIKLCGDTYVNIVADLRSETEWFNEITLQSIQCGVDAIPMDLENATVVKMRNTIDNGMPVINSIDIVIEGTISLITSPVIKGDSDEEGSKIQCR